MALIISTNTNEWPQIDDQNLMASTNMGGDKPTQEQIQQQQNLALKCPRCDSANTKFCYYNNYSLSQPRHFCKACKRYWTRGGTLRNVPVGGGCRKNKRVKRPAAAASSTPVAVDLSNNNSAKSAPISAINSSNPLFYHGLQHNSLNPNSSELNLSFNSRVDHGGNNNSLFEYDLQPQISSLGFSSSGQIMGGDLLPKSMLSSYHHLPNFGSFSSSVSASPSMASLLSNIQQQKVLSNGVLGDTRSGGSHFLGFSQYEDHMQMQGSHDNGGMSIKEFNTEESQNRSNDNQIPQMVSSDPNSIIWNASGVSSWLDPAKSIGYSVPSLI